jgi:hypothetical protein
MFNETPFELLVRMASVPVRLEPHERVFFLPRPEQVW